MNSHENGRSAWLHTIFDQFEGPLVRYAARLVGDTERGRDIVQDVFLQLCREDSGPTQDHLPAWLYTVCRNRALDVCRKERRVNSLPMESAASTATGMPDPAESAERQEIAHQALALLELLPENQREVIRLKIEHGLKYREISEITGLSLSNVGYLLHHGLQTLRKKMTQSHAGHETS